MVFAEVFHGCGFDGCGCDGLIAGEVFAEIAGVAGVLVVAVEGVGYAAKTAEALEPADKTGEVDSTCGIELFLSWAFGLKFVDLLPEGGFEVFELHVGLGGDGALGDGGELEGVVEATNGLSDLLFVDEDLIETAGLCAAEDVDEEVGVGVARGEGGRGKESYADLREPDGVGDGGAFLFGNGRGDGGDGINLGAAGDGAEVFDEQSFQFGGVEVSGDRHGGVVRGVELFEEVADIVEAGCFDVGVGADDIGVVGMIFGKEELIDFFAREVVGSAFALAALVADDVALVGEFFAIEAFEEEAHAVAFEPEG